MSCSNSQGRERLLKARIVDDIGGCSRQKSCSSRTAFLELEKPRNDVLTAQTTKIPWFMFPGDVDNILCSYIHVVMLEYVLVLTYATDPPEIGLISNRISVRVLRQPCSPAHRSQTSSLVFVLMLRGPMSRATFHPFIVPVYAS